MLEAHHGWRQGVAAAVAIAAIAGIAGILGGASISDAQQTAQGPAPQIFNGVAVNPGTPGGASGTGQLEVVTVIIERWSTEQERQALIQAFDQKGADGLLSVLQKMERLGTLRASSTLGWDLRYAVQVPTEDGGRRVIVATERKVSHWQAGSDKRTGYPFTLVELHLDKDDKGDGRLSVATKIHRSKDGQHFELENYSAEPIQLQNVHRQKN